MSEFLIAAVIDFSGEFSGDISDQRHTWVWPKATIAAVRDALEPGEGGSVVSHLCDGAGFAARADHLLTERQQAEWKPASSPDGSLTLLAGRLQERTETLSRLGLPSTSSDAQIYSAAHDLWGETCDKRLLGDYAVIQWIAGKRMLRLARSPTGLHPLHVWREGERIVAASIPRALLAAGMPLRINEDKLADSLLLNFADGRGSWYCGSHRIEAGTCEIHEPSGSRRQRYWSLRDVPQVRFSRDEDYVEALDEAFQRATRAELEGVTRPAVMLSGGLDSQAVTAYLATTLGTGRSIDTFTAVPQQGWSEPHKPYSFGDEAPHVRALAARYSQIKPHFIAGETRRFGQDLERLVKLGGWPMRNETNLHWIHEAYQGARDQKCDAMFWGAAGNSGFSYDGASAYASWFLRGNWAKLLRELREAHGDRRPLYRKFLGLALLPALPARVQNAIQSRRGRLQSPFETWCPLREDYAVSSGAMERARRQGFDPYFAETSSALEWRIQVLGELLSEGGEIECAFRLMHGIPSRDPTLFRPLVELTAGIPDDQYLRGGTDRWLARRLLKGKVPARVVEERRIGRQSPDWAMRFAKERERLAAELGQLTGHGLLGPALDIERLSRDFAQWPGTEDTAGLWKQKINAAIGRALSTARFLRYVETTHVSA